MQVVDRPDAVVEKTDEGMAGRCLGSNRPLRLVE
jgi:hypothetical protein